MLVFAECAFSRPMSFIPLLTAGYQNYGIFRSCLPLSPTGNWLIRPGPLEVILRVRRRIDSQSPLIEKVQVSIGAGETLRNSSAIVLLSHALATSWWLR